MAEWDIFDKLFVPLLRLVATMCVGLLAASLLESLHWTRFVARAAAPLARAGHLGGTSAAAFALAFFSPAASNALLAEAHARGDMTRRELVFANLFNSSPTFLVHLPTLFSLVFAFLGTRAFVYVGLCLAAATLRTACTILAGRFMLPLPAQEAAPQGKEREARTVRDTVRITVARFKKRISKLLLYTVPVYCLFFAMQQAGWFTLAEHWLADHAGWFSFLNPKALGIVAMYIVAESGAAFSAAAALAESLRPEEIIMALLAGTILSAPMRALRHQFPSYAGFFAPGPALFLVTMNQLFRAASLILVSFVYWLFI